MKKLLQTAPLLLVLVFVLGYAVLDRSHLFQLNLPTLSQAAGETKKEISKTPPGFLSGLSTFEDINPPDYLSVGSEYWVRLTINGKENAPPPYSGSDIMLVLDVTGSMRDSMPVGSSAPNTTTPRIQAAKQALQGFADDAKPQDYIGFATFTVCIPRNGQYTAAANNVPLAWAYEDARGTQTRSALGFVHQPLRQASDGQISSINSLLVDANSGAALRFTSDNIIFCQNNDNQGNQTNPGGGLVAGLSQLTNIIQNQTRSDSSIFRNSYAGNYANATYRADRKKYIVLATDGEENAFPRSYENQSIIQQLNQTGVQNAVEYAIRNNIIIYTLSIGHDGNEYASTLQRIANETGGKYFPGRNRDELISSYEQIYNEVESTSTQLSMTVHEAINTSNFSIPDLDPITGAYENRFAVSKSLNGGSEENMTNSVCPGGNCITKNSNSSYDFKLPAISSNESYYIYFKVVATSSTTTPVNVDSSESNVTFSDNTQTQITNKSVLINQPKPFFQATQGDVYSDGNMSSPLLANENLVTKPETILFHNSELNLGAGKSSSLDRKTSYNMGNQSFYSTFESALKSHTVNRTVTNGNINRASLAVTNSVERISVVKISSTTQEYVFNETGSFNDDITRIVFVDGNLYIRNGNYSVSKNGANALVFIVSGNLAFDQAITKAEGIFLVDGIVDTACDATGRFIAGECLPTQATAQLDIQGSLIVGNEGQIKLQRYGNPSEDLSVRKPGEIFTYRPDMVWPVGNILGKIVRSWKEVND